jgi:TRAP-type mannitol/chloroaromatic compound transport system permease small subunit
MKFLYYSAFVSAFLGVAFVINNFLTYIFDLPGLFGTLAFLGFDFFDITSQNYSGAFLFFGIIQSSSFLLAFFVPILILRWQRSETDAALLNSCSEIIVGFAFWSVMLIGIVDAAISFVRIEGLLPNIVGDDLALALGKPALRGAFIHIPLLFIGMIIAFYRRGFDFIWLALLIVLGELLIVITRFIFSYEQAFMGDLVRFWYAGLFLFSSAYTLVHEGHVRVDVLYANFTQKSKAYTNIFGSIFLGIPLCWVVLIRGCWHETSPFNLALLNFEVTQQGFGMYVKYLMSGFLIIFALSMLFQFSSYIISHINALDDKKENAVYG